MSSVESEAIAEVSSRGETSAQSLFAPSLLRPLVEVKVEQLGCRSERDPCDIVQFLVKNGLRLVSSDSWKEHQNCVPTSVLNQLDEANSTHTSIDSEVEQISQLRKCRADLLKSELLNLSLKREVSDLRYSADELQEKYDAAMRQVANLEERVRDGSRREDGLQQLLTAQQQLQAENETKSDLVANELTNAKGELEKVRVQLEQERNATVDILEQKKDLATRHDNLLTFCNDETARGELERNRFVAFLVDVASGLKHSLHRRNDEPEISDKQLAEVSQQLHSALLELHENRKILTKLKEIIMLHRSGKTPSLETPPRHNDNNPAEGCPAAQDSPVQLRIPLTSNSTCSEHEGTNGNECLSGIPVSSSYQNAFSSVSLPSYPGVSSIPSERGSPGAGKSPISMTGANSNSGNRFGLDELADEDTALHIVDEPQEDSEMTIDPMDTSETTIAEESLPCTSSSHEQPVLIRTFGRTPSPSMLLHDPKDSLDHHITELDNQKYKEELSLHQVYFNDNRGNNFRKLLKDGSWCCECCSEVFSSRRELAFHFKNFSQWWESKWEKSNTAGFSCTSRKDCVYQTQNVIQSVSAYEIECKECRSLFKNPNELFAHAKQAHNVDDPSNEILQKQPNFDVLSMSLPSSEGRKTRQRTQNIRQGSQNNCQRQKILDKSKSLRNKKRRDDKSDAKPRNCTNFCKCGLGFMSKTALMSHRRKKKYGSIFRCQLCEKCFDESSKLDRHLKSYHNYICRRQKKHFICGLCTTRKAKRFTNQSALRVHCNEEHLDELNTYEHA